MNLRIGPVIVAPFALCLGCFPPVLMTCEELGSCPATGTTTMDDVLPTSGGPVFTSTDASSDATLDTTATSLDSSGAGTDEPPDEPPEIVAVSVIPDYINENGVIGISVTTKHADGVRMELDTKKKSDLMTSRPDEFTDQISAFTGLDNRKYIVSFTPLRGEIVGASVEDDYVIALPAPGSEIAWQTPDVDGSVAAIAVLPDGRPVEFGTLHQAGEPRCYLRLREKTGAPVDTVSVLPDLYCDAIDMKLDRETGALQILLERQNAQKQVQWWAGELTEWNATPKKLGDGKLGDSALALASRPGLVAVCGARPVPTLDKFDALAVLLRPGQPAVERLFDLQRDDDEPHGFGETARDCAFSSDKLALVGEALGKHDGADKLEKRERLMLIEHNFDADTEVWTIAGPGPGTQSRALAIDIDSNGRYHLAGYTCLDDCQPEGDLRIYQTGGKLVGHVALGPLGSPWFGPHDIAWSPAGYVVIALGAKQGDNSVFKVQAYAPGDYDALWTFIPNNKEGSQMALAVAVGPYGEIYAGGIAETDHQAFAVIGG